MRRRAKSLVAGLLSLAAIYLIPVNLALNLPATRDTLNAFQPEQWRLNWSSAWSVLPMRVQLRGFAADGQTPKAHWQLDAKAVGASLSLAALLRGEVRISDLDLTDVEIRLRALAEPDAPSASADTAAADSLPSIRNRSPEATAQPRPVARKRSSGMKLAVADLRLAGQHAFWINRFRGEVDGTLGGSFALDAATGEVELTDGRVDLLLRSLTIAGIPDPTGDARLEGQIAIPAMSLASLSSPDSLRRIEIDGEVDIPVHNLAFVELFAGDLGALELTGKGRLTGRVVNLDGALQPGTAFSVDASELALAWPPYRFSGDGEVRLGLGTDQNEVGQVALDVRFGRVDGQLVRAADDGDDDAEAIALPLFTGQGLDAKLRFPPVSEADGSGPIRVPRVLLRIPEVEVPDLTLYNALLPPQWGLKLGGGDGRLSMQAELDEQALQLALDLSSTDAAIALADYRGRGDLSLEVKARAERGSAATLDLAGSSLRLGGVRIDRAEGEASADQANDADGAGAWDAAFVIDTARLAIPLTESSDDRDPLASLAKELAAGSFSSVLALADGQIAATLTVSRLDWISALLGRPLGLRVDGSGVVATDIVLEQGWPAAGTQLQVSPEGLRVAILEHVVDGQGNAVLDLQEGGRSPRARLGISIANGRLRRDDAQQASVDQVGLGLTVTGPLAAENAAQAATVELDIKSARVQDVSAFNAYLPPNAPLAIDSGEAALAGRLTLTADSAAGELVLEATEIGLTADDNALTADVLLNLNVRGGTPAEMRFDVGGSALRMQNVRVQGSTMSHDQPGWSARLQLNETELVWEKPMRLDLAAGITLQDTRPIVAILGNIRGKHDWIGKLLTADGLTGHLDLLLDDQGATIRDSRVLTDQVGIRFKGRSDPSGREAMLFVRYGQLAGALSQEGEQRRFSIIKARAKFDAYTPGETPLDTAGGDEVSEAEAAARSAADQESGAAAAGGDAADSTDLMQREKGRSTQNEPTGSAFLDNEN